jgi:hypothetical protein
MKSRRYFLVQGALATTAMLVVKPFTTIARAASSFTGFSGSYSKLVFLHTANLNASGGYQVIQCIKDIKNNKANAILLESGQHIQDETCQLTYDVSINSGNGLSAITGDYKIVTKGNLRTGIISAKPGESDIFQKINSLSTFLKKEKKCTIVVCLSQLGYKNKNTPDDITLANKSTHLDIIIGGHADNFHTHPIIALNSNNGEVIIHSVAGDPAAFGKIEIDFNEQGQKINVSFINKLSKNTAPNRAIPVA